LTIVIVAQPHIYDYSLALVHCIYMRRYG